MNDNPITIFDVANWFLFKKSFTLKQLQILCYYSQAWHLALLDKPLFDDDFRALIHNPSCINLAKKYRAFRYLPIKKSNIKPRIFSEGSLSILNSVFETYSDFSNEQLESLVRSELPWQCARDGVTATESSSNIISRIVMKYFYRDLLRSQSNVC